MWRTTRDSWVWQHLVCEGQPAPVARRDARRTGPLHAAGIGESQQNWFRPENRFPSRVFGSMVREPRAIARRRSAAMYFAVPRRAGAARRCAPIARVRIVPYDASQHEALCALAALARGRVYVTAEELDRDVELQAVDRLYRSVGLRRTRQVWLAYRRGSDAAGRRGDRVPRAARPEFQLPREPLRSAAAPGPAAGGRGRRERVADGRRCRPMPTSNSMTFRSSRTTRRRLRSLRSEGSSSGTTARGSG